MDQQNNFSRRNAIKWGLLAAGTSAISKVAAQNLGPGNQHVGDVGGRDHQKLFTGDHVVGGGQMEIRLNQSINTGDPHALEVAHRLKPFDPNPGTKNGTG